MKDQILKLSIYTREDFTDQSILDFFEKNKNFSAKEYIRLISGKTLQTELAYKILRFLTTYDSGFFKPDKCDAHEPIKEIFLENDIKNPVRWLSQPGGAFYFKQTRFPKIDGVIENCRFTPIWDDIDAKILLKPKVPEPIYKAEIKLFFSDKLVKTKGIDYWIKFIKHLCKIINAKIGILSTSNDEDMDDKDQMKEYEISIGKGARYLFLDKAILLG